MIQYQLGGGNYTTFSLQTGCRKWYLHQFQQKSLRASVTSEKLVTALIFFGKAVGKVWLDLFK